MAGEGLVVTWLYCSIVAACDWMSDCRICKVFVRLLMDSVALEHSEIESGIVGGAAGGTGIVAGGDGGSKAVTALGGTGSDGGGCGV